MTKPVVVLFALLLSFSCIGLAQEEGFEFRGEVPPVVPDGTVLDVMVVDDLMAFSTTPLARGEVRQGTFSIPLPADPDPDLLQEMRVCGGPPLTVALVPYLDVVDGEDLLGRFWRTSQAPGDWGMRGPSNYTYLAYVEDAYVAEEECWGDVVALDLQPGWNLFSRIVTDTGSLTTSAEPPAEFVWRFQD